MTRTPLGIRNNNPGNLRSTKQYWKGQVGEDSSGFAVFSEALWGIRAMVLQLLRYQDTYGLRSPLRIISRWAPPSENKTLTYAKYIAEGFGADLEYELDLWNPWTMEKLVNLIITYENGQNPYPQEIIQGAVLEAFRR
jgi:hypothetical protein